MPPKEKRAPWKEDQMANALAAIREGMSVLMASNKFKIPRWTLRNHINTGSTTKKLGRNAILNAHQENELCCRVFRMADAGMPITSNCLRRSVFTFCEGNGIKHAFPRTSRMAGRKWMKLFVGRHPEVVSKKAPPLIPSRAQKLNKVIVNVFFERLKNVVTELDIIDKPQNVYTVDVKECCLPLHHQHHYQVQQHQHVFEQSDDDDDDSSSPISSKLSETVTIVACGNAVGQCIPPMVLLKGNHLKPEWKDGMPCGSDVRIPPVGCMTTDIFNEWINNHFTKFKVSGPTVLIFDNVANHLDVNIIEAADNHEISLLCLPNNAAHELQPLQRTGFKTFEAIWTEELLHYFAKYPDAQSIEFGEIFDEVWSKCMTSSNIVSGFRCIGIYPFNRDALPESSFTPSSLIAGAESDNEPMDL